MSEVDKFLESDVRLDKAIANLYEATPIEVLKEEEFVYKSIIRGFDIKDILKDINRRHPDFPRKVNKEDIEWFLKRNPQVCDLIVKESKAMQVRGAEVALNHKMAINKLYDKSSNMLQKIEEHPDHDIRRDGFLIQSWLKLIKEIIDSDAKIRGIGGTPKTQINIMNQKAKDIVNNSLNNPTDFQKELMTEIEKAKEEAVDADYTIVEEDEDGGVGEES